MPSYVRVVPSWCVSHVSRLVVSDSIDCKRVAGTLNYQKCCKWEYSVDGTLIRNESCATSLSFGY